MKWFIVTVKLPRNPDHDPTNKVTGVCPISDNPCTDVTGQHHSYLVSCHDVSEARENAQQRHQHVTRIEEV